ncbi:heterokaryon incompatibility protein-domain-containing protein [Bisporella sp. PMI_857]|nr:heterokaryon incompatibility protein-domain-containing protein [Bisporella sp. PMI_857]
MDEARGNYETLSYCWGNLQESNLVSAVCNGFPVQLGSNLALALRHMRHLSVTRIVWVDALCINQEDNAERSWQVQLMGQIYGQASRTIIWLGDIREEDALAAFQVICHFVNSWDESRPAFFCQKKNGIWLKQCEDYFGFSGLSTLEGYYQNSSADYQKVVPLFSAEWFERKWVIQEAILSTNAEVLVPGGTIFWKWIGIAAAILRSNHDCHPSYRTPQIQTSIYNAYLMARMSRTIGLESVEVTFLQLLRLTAGFRTTQKLDAVFGILGLPCKDEGLGEQFVIIDYNMSYEGQMMHVAEKLMSLSEPLGFLSDAAGLWRDCTSVTPSWMPEWSVKKHSMLEPWILQQNESALNPARDLPFKRWP